MVYARWLLSAMAGCVTLSSVFATSFTACGGDDTGAEAGDAGPADARAEAAPARRDASLLSTARITLVNAAHDLGPRTSSAGPRGYSGAVRFCFAQGLREGSLVVVPDPPVPDRDGVGYGLGRPLVTSSVDFASRIVVPIMISARSLAAYDFAGADGGLARPCDQLVGAIKAPDVQLQENKDYWTLPAIEPGTFANDRTYLLALTGCVGDATTPNPGKCGAGFTSGMASSRGNVALTARELEPAPLAAPFGAQLLDLSTQASAFYSQARALDALRPGLVSSAQNGSGFRPFVPGRPTLGVLSPRVALSHVAETDAVVLGPLSRDPIEASRGVPLLPTSLVAVAAYSGLRASYGDGHNYVFVAVGDPDTGETKPFLPSNGPGPSGDGFNLRFFHFLAYPAPLP